ncbi:MAG TPA: helix-turn-helix domain-containing protein [Gemmatimonadales bacterium]|jgi:AraC family transcriptional regulator|nr:helix-turn-helix domain-containing protein [Gemmatimonadales bacterium]
MSSALWFARDTGNVEVRLVRYAPNCRMAFHSHDEHGVSIVLNGALVEETEQHSVAATAGWTVVKPAGTKHANRFGPEAATLLAITFRETIDEDEPGAWRWLNHPATYRAALRLLRWAKHGTHADRDDGLIELIASLRRPAFSRRELPWLRSVRSALEDPDQRESVGALAARAGVHPVYLARRFRGAFGCSLREFRRMAQLRRATQLILGTRRPLSEIAHRCGFADHSHMCRAFRVTAGINPTALRAS